MLLENTPAQAKSLLHSLEQTVRDMDLNINSNKTEFMCFNQVGAISSLNGKPLKLVDDFTYLNRNMSSTENDDNVCINNVWATIDRLMTKEIRSF